MSELPKGWASATLADLGVWKGGGTPSKAHAEYWGGGIPWVSPKDMKSATIRTTVDTISAEAIQNSSTSLIKAGSVLIVTRSGILARTLPVAVNALDVTVNQDMRALTPHPWILPEFVRYFLQGSERAILQGCVKDGTTVHSVELSSLMAWSLPIPPLPEQHRIVAKIEELFSELDASEESLTRARAQLGLYRQSLLKAAFQGTLTADWRAANPDKLETPEALLARIRKEREDRYRQALEDWQTALSEWRAKGEEGRKPQKPLRPDEIHSPVNVIEGLPACWAEISLGNLAYRADLGKMLDQAKNKGVPRPYFGNINLRWGSFAIDRGKTIPIEDHEVERYGICKGDLVICEGGEPGRCAVWIGNDNEFFIQKALHRVRFTQSYSPYFAFYFMVYSAVSGHLERHFTGSTIKHLTGSSLAEVSFPVCCIGEQDAVVEVLDRQFSEIEGIETEISTALAKITPLRQSILKKAFAGELVPQDPADEPATALLARIKAEATAPKSRSPRRKAPVHE